MNFLRFPPFNNGQHNQRVKGWALGAALLGIGLLPCPECGMPVATHAWPFLLLWAVNQLVKRRGKVISIIGQGDKIESNIQGGAKDKSD